MMKILCNIPFCFGKWYSGADKRHTNWARVANVCKAITASAPLSRHLAVVEVYIVIWSQSFNLVPKSVLRSLGGRFNCTGSCSDPTGFEGDEWYILNVGVLYTSGALTLIPTVTPADWKKTFVSFYSFEIHFKSITNDIQKTYYLINLDVWWLLHRQTKLKSRRHEFWRLPPVTNSCDSCPNKDRRRTFEHLVSQAWYQNT